MFPLLFLVDMSLSPVNLLLMSVKLSLALDTMVGQSGNTRIKKIVKQGFIFGPIMCYATKSKAKNIGKGV